MLFLFVIKYSEYFVVLTNYMTDAVKREEYNRGKGGAADYGK